MAFLWLVASDTGLTRNGASRASTRSLAATTADAQHYELTDAQIRLSSRNDFFGDVADSAKRPRRFGERGCLPPPSSTRTHELLSFTVRAGVRRRLLRRFVRMDGLSSHTWVENMFLPGAFWGEYSDRLPVHCAIWRGQSTLLVTCANVGNCLSLSGRLMAPNRSGLGADVIPSVIFVAASFVSRE